MTDPRSVAIDLTDEERKLMVLALNEYAGEAQYTYRLLCPALGQSNLDGWGRLVNRLKEAIKKREPLCDLDWARAMFLTDICFGSTLVGSGLYLGRSVDYYRFRILRSIQEKVSSRERFDLLVENASYPSVESSAVDKGPRTVITDPELFAVDLTDEERELVDLALNEYAGTAQHTYRLLCPVLGQSNKHEWFRLINRLAAAIENKEPLSDLDWARVMFLTDISFGSTLVGSGLRFGRGRDQYWFSVLRSLQEKIRNPELFDLLVQNAISSCSE
jgi:hypothetical protein